MNYANIKCPKCGKSHFEVKEGSFDVFGLTAFTVFTPIERPVYKDGVLQNPPKPKLIKKYFKCRECECNFRIEFYDENSDDFTIIDQDKERQEWLEKQSEIKIKNIESDKNTNNTSTSTGSGLATSASLSTIALADTQTHIVTMDDRLKELEERIEKLEAKEN